MYVNIVVYDPYGVPVLNNWSFEPSVKRNYYRYWDFLSLDDVFWGQLSEYGRIIPGVYTVDLFMDGEYAAQTTFRISN